MVIDLKVYYDLNDQISTHVNDKRMQKSKSAHQNHRRGHQNSKNDIWRYRRSLTLDILSVPRKGHDIIISVQTMDITPRRAHPRWHAQRPIDVHITSKKTPSSQVIGVKTLRNANFSDMTLKAGHRSNKGHGRYNLEIFREDANFQGLSTHNFVTINRIVRVLFSENPRRGCNLHQPPYQPAYPSSQWHIQLETGIAKHCLGAKIVVYACL